MCELLCGEKNATTQFSRRFGKRIHRKKVFFMNRWKNGEFVLNFAVEACRMSWSGNDKVLISDEGKFTLKTMFVAVETEHTQQSNTQKACSVIHLAHVNIWTDEYYYDHQMVETKEYWKHKLM